MIHRILVCLNDRYVILSLLTSTVWWLSFQASNCIVLLTKVFEVHIHSLSTVDAKLLYSDRPLTTPIYLEQLWFFLSFYMCKFLFFLLYFLVSYVAHGTPSCKHTSEFNLATVYTVYPAFILPE